MIVYAAIDLRGGRVVQLVGGRPEKEKVSWPDPVAVARRWQQAGFPALHVVDLDAALGGGDNREAIARILASVDVPVQVGGGVRDDAAVEWLIEAGAARVIVGTRAIEDPEWLGRVAARHPLRVVVAADVRHSEVVMRGWTEGAGIDALALLERLEATPLAGVLVTDVSREGQMVGIDEEAFTALAAATSHPLIAAGGIGGADDLWRLSHAGCAGAVLGMALYTGAVDPAVATREFAA